MTKHIGIVAVSHEGAALFYRQIFRQASHLVRDAHQHPKVSLHNEPLADYIDAVRVSDWEEVGRLLQKSARILAACGASFCMSPDNAVQHAVHIAEAGSPIPWLTMPDLVAQSVAADGRRVVGVLGTKWVTTASTYQTHLGLKGIKVVVPTPEDADVLDNIILNELIYGEIQPKSQARVLAIIDHLAERGAEAIILASSEAPLAVNAANCSLPLYDAANILARGAVLRALKPD